VFKSFHELPMRHVMLEILRVSAAVAWLRIMPVQDRFCVLRSSHRPGHGLYPGAGPGIKVFWFFSSERNMRSSLYAGGTPVRQARPSDARVFFSEEKNQKTFASAQV
jgi:hypothetical protein